MAGILLCIIYGSGHETIKYQNLLYSVGIRVSESSHCFVYGMRMFPQCLKARIICNSTIILFNTHIQPLPAIFGNTYTSCTSYESREVVPNQSTM